MGPNIEDEPQKHSSRCAKTLYARDVGLSL
jgi:hypothetical protein